MNGRRPAPAQGAAAASGVRGRRAAAAVAGGLDYRRVAGEACEFIRRRVEAAGAGGVVFGLSGGIDSSVVAHLSARALGAERCLALIMPNESFTPDSETSDGLLVAEKLGIRHMTIPIGGVSDAATGASGAAGGGGKGGGGGAGAMTERVAVGNLNARLRAALLYYEAQLNGYLVVGTDDRSEYLIGYFTKYGDGASDMLPIADLYKTQVQRLGRHLGVPDHIVKKAPSPHLWKGHDAAGELGVGYADIDAILSGSVLPGGTSVCEKKAVRAAAAAGISPDAARHIAALNRASAHKRALPPFARLRAACAAPGRRSGRT